MVDHSAQDLCTIVASRQKYQKEPHDVCTSFNSDDEHYWFSAISKLPMAYETNFECWMDLKNWKRPVY